MKIQLIKIAVGFCFILGCSDSPTFGEFELKTKFEMRTDGYDKVSGKKTGFRDYLTPFAKIERGGREVLFGFIFREIDWIDGVAYLIKENGEVLDSLLVSEIDPPNETWVEVEEKILVLESGGMMEDDAPFPPGRNASEWVDTLEYQIGKSTFERVEGK